MKGHVVVIKKNNDIRIIMSEDITYYDCIILQNINDKQKSVIYDIFVINGEIYKNEEIFRIALFDDAEKAVTDMDLNKSDEYIIFYNENNGTIEKINTEIKKKMISMVNLQKFKNNIIRLKSNGIRIDNDILENFQL